MKTFTTNSIIGTHSRPRPGKRIVALLATVAISAFTAVRLDAVVIDDFENGVKFAMGGGGTNYLRWGLTNGQMVVSRQNPIPTPTNSVGTTYDNVYWPNSLPGVSLEGGRTLELRMDLNHTSADDLFLLMGGATGDAGYNVIIDRNEVALMKLNTNSVTTFYWDALATTNENVTVRLAFTKTNGSLAITVKIVDKGNQRATLYERSFVDGPGQDGPVPPPDPHGTKIFKQDPGVPYTEFNYAWAGVLQVIYTTPPPLEMLLDNLEYDLNQAPVADASASQLLYISPNGVNASVTLDGSRSSDPDGDTLDYLWFSTIDSQPSTILASGMHAVVVLPGGLNPIELVVNDGMATATNAITVEVITTAQAVERLIAQVQSEWRRSQPLLATLYAALHSIERGNPVSARNQLQAFQNKVRAQVAPRDPALAASFTQAAQEIIEAFARR